MARLLRSALVTPVALVGAALVLTACAGPRYVDGGYRDGAVRYADNGVVIDRAPLPFDPRPLPPNTAPGDCVTPLPTGGDYRWALIACQPTYAQAGYGYGYGHGGGHSRYYEAGGERYAGYSAHGGYSQSGSGYSYGSGYGAGAAPYGHASGYAYGPGYDYSYGHDPRGMSYAPPSGLLLGGPMSGGVGYSHGFESYGYGGYGYGQGVSSGYGYPPAWGGYRTTGRDAWGYLVWPGKR